jgi:hypothetical protein
MSTDLVEFQNHTAAVGNKTSSISFIASQNALGGMSATLMRRLAFFTDGSGADLGRSLRKTETAAAEPPDVGSLYAV